MKKKIISICVIALVIVLALFVFTACNTSDTDVGQELVTNGGFENWDETDKTFDNWSWVKKDDNSKYLMQPIQNYEPDGSEGDYSENLGERYLTITNSSGSYGYLQQSIKVDRKKIYKVTVDMKLTTDITKGTNSTFRGAHVTFSENTESYFVENKESFGGWRRLTFYVRPVNTDYMTISLALGAENGTAKGSVSYDNVSMQRVDSVPSDAKVYDFYKAKIARYKGSTEGILFVVFLTLLSAALLVAAYVLIRRIYARRDVFTDIGVSVKTNVRSKKTTEISSGVWYKNVWFIAAMLALGTFLIRLILLLTTYGFGSEMNYAANLAKLLGQSGGVTGAYATYGSSLATTSPGTVYILAIIGAMGQNLDYAGISVLIRMVGVLADIATVLLIYFYGRKYVGNKLSLIFAALYAALPVIWIMSGVNGTFESVLVALLLSAVILTVEKQYIPMYVVMVLAAILDIRSLAIAPVIVGYLGYMYYKDDDKRYKPTKNRIIIAGGLIGSFVLAYILTLPVGINQIQAGQPFYNFTILANMMTQNIVFVENAFNLYAMVGMNMKTTNATVNVLNLIFLLVLEIYAVSLYIKNKNKQEIFLIASFVLAVIAVFTLKVNFTYLFLAIALGLVYTMISGDKRMYGIMGMYSLLGFICLGQIMNNSGYVTTDATGYIVNFETTSPDLIIFSVIAVLTTLYYAYVSYSITNNGKIVDIRPMPQKFVATVKSFIERTKGDMKTKRAEKNAAK